MKILLPFSLVAILSIPLYGQSTDGGTNDGTVYNRKEVSDAPVSAPFYFQKPNLTTASYSNKSSYDEEVLGTTTYGLQTNGSVQNRIMRDDNGNISAVWTASEMQDNSWSDRGTGYSFFDGTSWNLSGDYPRIESVRCGWPNILYPASGGEVIISHQSIPSGSTSTTKLIYNSRATKGSGSWTEKSVSNTGLTWPRAAMGGPDGNSIHLIAVTDEKDSLKFQKLRRALVYYRSTDGGSTFDIQDSILPGLDASAVGPMGGDSYAIAANGDTIVIGVFDNWNDIIMLKSTDNGDTWSKTVAWHHSKPKTDIAKDTLTTPTIVPDGSGAIRIGKDGTVHLFWSYIQAWNEELEGAGNEVYQYLGNTDGLLYWNDTKAADDIDTIARAIDYDNSGTINLSGTWPNYGLGYTSLPSTASADDGTIYLSYAGIHEIHNDLGSPAHNYRHIYIIKSEDNGASWSEPIDINPYDEIIENLYASLYPEVIGEDIHMLYQRDSDPGNATTDGYPVTSNEIVYAKINIALNIGIEVEEQVLSTSTIFPNPAKNQVTVNYSMRKPSQVSMSIVNITGQRIFERQSEVSRAGDNLVRLDISNIPAGIYFVNIVPATGKISTHKLVIK